MGSGSRARRTLGTPAKRSSYLASDPEPRTGHILHEL